jgi:hypothetical protein
MENKNQFLKFHNYSLSQMPHNILARYYFESDYINIPNSPAFMEIHRNTWVFLDENTNDLFQMTMDQFTDIYMASDKKAQNYYEFVLDSISSDYVPFNETLEESLLDSLDEFVEKEMQLNYKSLFQLIWNKLCNKKLFIKDYFTQ